MIKAALFDIDGTLLDSVEFHALAWQTTLRQHGVRAELGEVREQIGKGGDKLLAVFLSEDQIEREGKQIEQERADLFKREYLARVKPFPRVTELFERLKADGIRMALATSARKEELESYKRIIGIEPFLEAQTSSDDASHSKPDPDIFTVALQSLKSVAPDEAVAIGDTPYDAEAAGKAGISTIGFECGGWPRAKLLAAGCIQTYRDPADLLEEYAESPFHRVA